MDWDFIASIYVFTLLFEYFDHPFTWKCKFVLLKIKFLPLDGVILIDPEALQGRKGLYKIPELILLGSFFCIYVHGHSHTGLKELHLDSLF